MVVCVKSGGGSTVGDGVGGGSTVGDGVGDFGGPGAGGARRLSGPVRHKPSTVVDRRRLLPSVAAPLSPAA